MSEGVGLSIALAALSEEFLRYLVRFHSMASGLDAVVHVPGNQAPADLGVAGLPFRFWIRRGGGCGDGRGKDAGAGESAEKGGGEKCGWMHCQSSVLLLWIKVILLWLFGKWMLKYLEKLLRMDLENEHTGSYPESHLHLGPGISTRFAQMSM